MVALVWVVMCLQAMSTAALSDSKIIGGFLVKDVKQTPYVISIQHRKSNGAWSHNCSGSLISAIYVITSCHCVAENASNQLILLTKTIPLNYWLFVAGAINSEKSVWQEDTHMQARRPLYLRFHPQCKLKQNPWILSPVSVNDVGLAKMWFPFNLNEYVQPAELVSFSPHLYTKIISKYYSEPGRCVISGWGSVDTVPVLSDIARISTTPGTTEEPIKDTRLKMLGMSIQDGMTCWGKMLEEVREDTEGYVDSKFSWDEFGRTLKENLKGQLCGLAKTESPCTGDDGAGLICDGSVLAGVNSWGIGCGGWGVPSVIQNMAPVLNWLKDEVCKFSSCVELEYEIAQCYSDDSFHRECRQSNESRVQAIRPPERVIRSKEPRTRSDWLIPFAVYHSIKTFVT